MAREYSLIKRNSLIGFFATLIAVNVSANEANQTIKQLAKDASIISRGKALYEQVCASCHAKDLSGASGFNLKDGEWIHGKEPAQILHNVKNGFASAGMPGFGAVFSEQELKSVVAYVLSKREGFDSLSYKIYQMENADDREIDASKLVKTGQLATNIADFQLPEITHYVIEFEGDFYVPYNENVKVWLQWGKPFDIEFEVDGEPVERVGEWDPTWTLKPGRQHLKITYRAGNNAPDRRNLSLIVTNNDQSIKLFPISTRARQIMAGKKIELKATDKTIVQRKKIHRVPPHSISVGLPAKVNYAFNTRSCTVVGLWRGEMINVGPNVEGRGQDASLPLGEWVFHEPQSLQLLSTDQTKCRFKGYKFENSEPVFLYQFGDTKVSLTATANDASQINFHYQVESAADSELAYHLPHAEGLTWILSSNKVTSQSVKIKPNAQGKFTISAQLTESK